MRVVAGLERQKSTRDIFDGAGGEPESRPMPPVLSESAERKKKNNKKEMTSAMVDRSIIHKKRGCLVYIYIYFLPNMANLSKMLIFSSLACCIQN